MRNAKSIWWRCWQAADLFPMTPEEMQSFRETLANANRVIALCGAGLSAASGLGVIPLLSMHLYLRV